MADGMNGGNDDTVEDSASGDSVVDDPQMGAAMDGTLDFTSEAPREEAAKIEVEPPLDPRLRMLFAQQVLLGAAIIGVVFAIIGMFAPPVLFIFLPDLTQGTESTKIQEYVLTMGKSIFGVVTTVIPPIITLVIGFYFGKKSSD